MSQGSAFSSRFRHPLLWIVTGLIIVMGITTTILLRSKGEPLPVLATLPPFELKTQENKTFTLEDLKGEVSVINFIFTSCPDVCPLLTQQMQKLQARATELKLPVRLVSISVDPETDTPSVLKAYSAKYGANLNNWIFLTGSLNDIEKVILEGFKVGFEKGNDATDLFDITHSEHFVVVDRLGRIRAYKRAANNAEIDIILADVAALAR